PGGVRGRAGEGRGARVAEGFESPADHLTAPHGDAGAVAGEERARIEIVTPLEAAHDLPEEERIATRGPVHRRYQRARRDGAAVCLHEARHVVLLETAQGQVAARPGETAEETAERGGAAHLPVPVRAQDEDRCLLQLAGEVLQQEQRRLVRGVEIVQHHGQGSLRRQGADDGLHGVEQQEPRLVWTVERRALDGLSLVVRRLLCHLGNELSEVREGVSGVPPEPLAVAAAQRRAQHLDPGPVRRRTAALPAPPPEHGEAARGGVRGRLLGKAGLADPRLPADEVEGAAPRPGGVECAAQLGELPLATDERRMPHPARDPGHRGRARRDCPLHGWLLCVQGSIERTRRTAAIIAQSRALRQVLRQADRTRVRCDVTPVHAVVNWMAVEGELCLVAPRRPRAARGAVLQVGLALLATGAFGDLAWSLARAPGWVAGLDATYAAVLGLVLTGLARTFRSMQAYRDRTVRAQALVRSYVPATVAERILDAE